MEDEEAESKRAKIATVAERLGISDGSGMGIPVDMDTAYLNVNVMGSKKAAVAMSALDSATELLGIPLTLLTGFLGAGKSTVLNYLLRAPHGLRIAVLINEFGKIDIDNQLVDRLQVGGVANEKDLVSLDNGCICCTISNGFVEAVKKMLESCEEVPDYVVVETTGLADPEPIMGSIRESELAEWVYLDQVLTVVDATSWDGKTHYDSGTAIKQIQFADTILLSKTDLISPERVTKVVADILETKENARIIKSQGGVVPVEAIFDITLSESKSGIQEKSEGRKLNPSEKHHQGSSHCHEEDCSDHCHHHREPQEEKIPAPNHLAMEGFTSVAIDCNRPFDLEKFRIEFVENPPPGVFRAKGIIWFDQERDRFIFHLSGGNRMTICPAPWPEGQSPRTQFVVIGRNLDEANLKSLLEGFLVSNPSSLPDDEESDDEESVEEDVNDTSRT
uniref:CobW C-terminal domain-containing protein n=1 Tax=Compsopogon caeruleus TaxID=31354 RepID=A0A7S1XFP9_9RHOD